MLEIRGPYLSKIPSDVDVIRNSESTECIIDPTKRSSRNDPDLNKRERMENVGQSRGSEHVNAQETDDGNQFRGSNERGGLASLFAGIKAFPFAREEESGTASVRTEGERNVACSRKLAVLCALYF